MMRPAEFDPHFFTAAGADDAAKYGPGTFVLSSLSQFRIGGPWDAQRANGQNYAQFRGFSNVAIGLYAGAAGLTADEANMIADVYASGHSTFTGQVMDAQFQNLPAANVDNTSLGVSLATTGGRTGVCTPGARP